MRPESLVVSCEHASNYIPAAYRHLFRGAGSALRGHQGWDIGAAQVAEVLARACEAPLFLGQSSRLLIDLNRSLHHPEVFSKWTRPLPPDRRQELIELYYLPYRRLVEDRIRAGLRNLGRVVHISVHSFTPVWNETPRTADIGLLYDPSRPAEAHFCAAWKKALATFAPELQIRRNYPYRGTSDGFSVALRRTLRSPRYACIELEINQALLTTAGTARTVTAAVREALDRTLQLGTERRTRRSRS